MSPPSIAMSILPELTPTHTRRYLLGSGGTLVFDLTIMIQSFVYGSAPPIDERDQEDYIEPHHHHHRSQSSRRHSKRIVDEESRPLIERPDEE